MAANINIYDVYGKCWKSGSQPNNQFELYAANSDMGFAKVGNSIKAYKKFFTAEDYTPFLFSGKKSTNRKQLLEIPPCAWGLPIIEYYNNPTVRQLLHIPNDVPAFDFCSDRITYNIGQKGSQWIYNELKNKYRIIFYSGDTDGAVPTYGTLQWMAELDWAVKSAYRPYYLGDQVAGYIEEKDGLTFATIHGAGHMTPQFKPAETYYLLFNWLKGKQI